MIELVHVVDDDEAIRDAVGFLLASTGFEVRLYDGPEAVLAALPNLGKGCILSDMRMPGMDGLELLRQLRTVGNALPVVLMTGHGDVPLAVEAMKLGACDFIEKPFGDEALLQTLHSALEQGRSSRSADPVLQEFVRRVATLSERERQVLDHLVAGGTSKEIGRALEISPRTVEIYRAKLMAKTQASNLSELVRWAVLAGLGPV